MSLPLLWTAATLVVVTFVWAGGAKTVGYARWRAALAGYGLPRSVEVVAAPGIPVVELAAAGLIALVSVKVGAALSLSLLALFCAAILRARSQSGDRLPCGCFGSSEAVDYRAMLLRNALLAAACSALLLGRADGALVTSFEAPAPSDILPLVLVGAGLVMASWMVRQAVGSLRRREHP